ncbi:hypothetical protein H2248_001668 [Termitomyces sp. 'cryptogamus']|nr:hypothetical protein H2248_001668 [Termitomyces sp. 'cryptogamus']
MADVCRSRLQLVVCDAGCMQLTMHRKTTNETQARLVDGKVKFQDQVLTTHREVDGRASFYLFKGNGRTCRDRNESEEARRARQGQYERHPMVTMTRTGNRQKSSISTSNKFHPHVEYKPRPSVGTRQNIRNRISEKFSCAGNQRCTKWYHDMDQRRGLVGSKFARFADTKAL